MLMYVHTGYIHQFFSKFKLIMTSNLGIRGEGGGGMVSTYMYIKTFNKIIYVKYIVT